ncbi:carboxypeptidase-like regulatory domain-containing protein [uncultured Polaribacter sp.]|uniref:carboxypeptidase-like regulatory domain-containing protein n=1 Tax=uncultured Polaribacter sp. TaxID=174711 RepID=UPI002630FF3F|nr:carboxypeptidase-like regulatory domain-containing protein [uncultured Polaribacter sp.]
MLDISTKKPVVYATVMLKNINRGTHADSSGNFEIPLAFRKTGIIRISSIGYKTKEIKLSNLKQNSTNTIYLAIAKSSLDEIVIKTSKRRKKRLLAKQIVRKAIENILENYPTEAHSYIGYYRDYQQPVGDSYQKAVNSQEPIKYLNVHEAILESFDDGFDSDKLKSTKNQTLLYNYRTNKDFIQDSTLTVPYDNKSKKYSESVYITPLGGNELNILDLTNAIRNYDKMSFSFTNIFQRDFLRNHKFKVKRVVFSDETPLYKISFTSINEKTSFDYSAFGSIYIAKQDFAIHKLNYNLYYKRKKNPQYTVTIAYQPKKDKMYLNYITFNNFFEASNGNYFQLKKTSFHTKQHTFKLSFNRKIALNSLESINRNFKIYYKNEKLKVVAVRPFDTSNNTLIVFIDEKSINRINLEKEQKGENYATNFTFDISHIKDSNGFTIDERASIKMNQYREFFVQEIFENKKLLIHKSFIDKSLPLSKSLITPLKLENSYWMNTPLKVKKGK